MNKRGLIHSNIISFIKSTNILAFKVGDVMKVTISKGPNYKKVEKEAYKLLYQFISKKIKEDEFKSTKVETKVV